MHRNAKQTVILLVFIAIIAIIAFLVYWAIQTPESCFDGIQNQNETGIDCGGICELCEEEKKDLRIVLSKIIPTLPDKYNVVLKINNPNDDYGVGNLKYNVHFFGSSGSLIKSYGDESYILPRSTKTIILSALDVKNNPKSIKVEFGEINWTRVQDYDSVPLIVVMNKSYKSLVNRTAFGEAKGVVVNKSDFDFDKINVNISLLDSNRNIIDAATTEIRTLLSGEEREFIYSWFYPVGDVSEIEVEAETNVFRSENFMKRHGGLEEFQKF